MNSKKKFLKKHLEPINASVTKFIGFRRTITRSTVENFLCMFEQEHMFLGLRVLQNVNYYSNAETRIQIGSLITLLGDKLNFENDDTIYFVPVSSSSGTSSQTITHYFRQDSGMRSEKYSERFINFSDLEKWKNNTDRRTIIFLDDFIGSGTQISSLWIRLQNYHNHNHNYYVGVLLGFQDKINIIQDETPFKIISVETLCDNDRIFDNSNVHFNKKEKVILKQYCRDADSRKEFQYGFKCTQSMIIFYDHAPNNSIPILHHKSEKWLHPLFLQN